MNLVPSLQSTSFTSNLEVISNNIEILSNLCESIDYEFKNKNFYLIEEIKRNLSKIKIKMKLKNFTKKLKESETLRIMASVHFYENDNKKLHDIRILDYNNYTVHPVPIIWKMWDKHLDQIKVALPEIKWDKYSKVDHLLCTLFWASWRGPNYYNKELKKENQEALREMRYGCFGKFEFFILLDGYNRNFMNVPFELISIICNNSYCNINIMKALKYVNKNKIRIVRTKHTYTYSDSDCYGLKTLSYDDFIRINYPDESKRLYDKDWIEYGISDKYLHRYDKKRSSNYI